MTRLKAYKAKEGDCNVPAKYPKDKQLGKWVSTQRQYYRLRNEGKPNHITDERVASLNSIDFDWHAPPYKPESDSEGETGESEEDEMSDEESLRPRSRRGRDERDHDPGAKNWTPEEDEVIDSMQAEYGNKWSIIAALGITVIGLPFAKQHIKLIPVALLPFGRDLRRPAF